MKLFLQWGNSGGLPVIVPAPVNVEDCYELTAQAFKRNTAVAVTEKMAAGGIRVFSIN